MPMIIDKCRKIFFPRHISYDKIYKRLFRFYANDTKYMLHLGAGKDILGLEKIGNNKLYLVSLDMNYGQLSKNLNRLKVLGDANNLPFRDSVFDCIFADAFFEHVRNPGSVLAECSRVSKKNAALIFTTPNKFFYVSLFNLYAPETAKETAKKFRGVDIQYFPVHYNFNTRKDIYALSGEFGYNVKALHYYTGHPSYFSFSSVLWILFAIVHKVIEETGFLSHRFHSTFIGILEKNADA